MNEHLEALLIVSAFILLFMIIFYPQKGLFYKWRRNKSRAKRILIEDSLKQIYDCEYRNVKCSIKNISKKLLISEDSAEEIIYRLKNLGLIEPDINEIQLTADGRSYALRIIRIHRLWEKYLADETMTDETDWHRQAELKEHLMSDEEADKFAAQIGNPVYDPHGDPIPTSYGEIPENKGKSLNELQNGEFAQIIHIEDEPNTIYSQLVAEGLYAGMHIRLIENTNNRIRFEANGEEIILSPILASNITVGKLSKIEEPLHSYKTLAALKIGEEAVVVGIARNCRGAQRRRLMDFGIVPGSKITAELKSAGGDPIAYKIRGASIALRKNQAKQIFIKEIKEEKVLT